MNGLLAVRIIGLLAFAGSLSWPMPVAAEVRYTVTDLSHVCQAALGDRGIVDPLSGWSLNDHGQVVGSYVEVFEDNVGNLSKRNHAFFWDDSRGLQDLGRDTIADAINNAAKVIGEKRTIGVGEEPGGLFVWDQDGIQFLTALTGVLSRVRDINNLNQVVGVESSSLFEGCAFIWSEEEGFSRLFPGEHTYSTAAAINDKGQAIGTFEDVDGESHAFLWDALNGRQDLGLSSVFMTYDINDAGQVLGRSWHSMPTDEDPNHRVSCVAVWEDGELNRIEELARDGITPIGINDDAQVLAQVPGEDGLFLSSRVLLWREDIGVRDLNNLIASDSSWRIPYAYALNNSGSILALAFDDAEVSHVVLLTPIPEPRGLIHLFGLVVVGVIMTCLKRRVMVCRKDRTRPCMS